MYCQVYKGEKMSRQRGSVTVVIIIVLGCLLAAGVYWLRPKPERRPPVEAKPPAVSVIKVNAQRQQMQVSTQGTVLPSREINLVAEVAGRVVTVSEQFVNGGFFDKGDVMVTLDKRDYQYRLAEADAQVAAAERELALEKGQARQAKREWRDLGSDEANALSLREPQVKAAQAQLQAAIAQRQQAKLDVERTVIRAPFRGRIQLTNVNVGQYVSINTSIATIYDSARAEVRLPLTDKQLALVGLPLGLTLNQAQQKAVTLSATVAGQKQQWPATLTRTEASVDSSTRLYFAVAEIPEPFDLERYASPLVPGLFVEADIEGVEFDAVIRVPEIALVNNAFVFIVDDNNRLQKRKVFVVAKENNDLWVQGELTQDEFLVVSDPKILQENLHVTKNIIE